MANGTQASGDTAMHVFERAGLGLAPFRVVGCTERRGPIRTMLTDGTMMESGAPGQPMGCCKYCYTGIAICYAIKSADGKIFDVGSDCVKRTGDAGMVKTVNKMITAARHAAEKARIDRAVALFATPDVRAALGARPHPVASMAANGRTLADSIAWMFAHAGNAGKIRAAKQVEAAAEVRS